MIDFIDRVPAERRWIAALSAVGAANMALGTLVQTGVIRRLPDPPSDAFDSEKVLLSPQAFALGVPDAPVAMTGLLANIPLAFAGGARRGVEHPWLPVVIAAKAVVEVSVAAWYLVQMRTRLHTLCAYCLVGSTISAALAVLTMRDAARVLETPRARLVGAAAALGIGGIAFAAMTLIDSRHRARDGRMAPLGA
ncbi:MAG TPA: vitamin K epoxide reductase family protein [Gemmatimonadaceae bacterium]|nr:vitamin K epoxide reductase family protein [Gemmatimonadaceae bacterium]